MLNGPVAGHQDVQGGEGAPAGLAGAQGVEATPAEPKPSSAAWMAARSSSGHARSSRPPVKRRTRPTPVTTMFVATASAMIASSRSQPGADSGDAGDDADRHPHVGDQMTSVGFQRDRAVVAASAQQREVDDEVDQRRAAGDRQADADVLRRRRCDEAADGDPGDACGRDQDESTSPPPRRCTRPWRARRCVRRPATASTAAARFMADSKASDSSPADPLSCHASVFSAMVVRAAATAR